MLLSVIYVDENWYLNVSTPLWTKANPKTALSMPVLKIPYALPKHKNRGADHVQILVAFLCRHQVPLSREQSTCSTSSIPQPTILYISWTRDVLVNSPEGSLICSSNIHCIFIFERESPSNCDASAVLLLSSETVFLIETFQSCRWLKGRS